MLLARFLRRPQGRVVLAIGVGRDQAIVLQVTPAFICISCRPGIITEEIRRRRSERDVQTLEPVFALRATAQMADSALSEWMSGTVGSFPRYQILMALWATKRKGIPHKDIVAAMGVTRATVSGLMAALEREGFVKSYVDREDRRKLIARSTARGEAVVKKAFEANVARFRAVFASLSSAELTSLTALLHRVREGFATAH